MRCRTRRACRRLSLIGLALVLPAPLPAQEASPPPLLREQDELDFLRASMAVGSGARALGMGGAFLARPDDATAASWNPAGLSYLRLPEVSLVGAFHSQDVKTPGRADHTQGSAPDFVSMALPISLGAASGAVQLSFQRVIPYSGERSIEEEPPKAIEASGGFDVVSLGTGLKLTRWLRAGVTVNRWFNGFHQQRERLQRRRSIQETDFGISGVNFNAGLIVQPHETVNVGVMAKTRLRADVELARNRRDFVSVPDAPDIPLFNQHSSDDVRLDLPGAVGFGASWRPDSLFTLSADYTRTFWSRARVYNYFTLAPGVEENSVVAPPPPDVFPIVPFPNVVDEQRDTDEVRVGVEYVVILGRPKLPLRAGYFRAKHHSVDSEGRTYGLDGLTAGVGLVLGPVLLDAAYVFQWGDHRTGSERRTARLHSALLSLNYRLGAAW